MNVKKYLNEDVIETEKIKEISKMLDVDITLSKRNSMTYVLIAKHNKLNFGELTITCKNDKIDKISPLPKGIFSIKKIEKIVKGILFA